MSQPLEQTVDALVRNSLDERELTWLAHYCHTVAKAIIAKFHAKHLSHFSFAEYDLESTAWRCIEDLFSTREGIPCYELHAYFSRRATDAVRMTPPELEIAFRKLVSRHVSQTIPEIYCELDTMFGRILRSVRRHIKSSRLYAYKASVHGPLVYCADGGDPLLHLPEYPREELLCRLFECASASMPVTRLIGCIFDELAAQSACRRSLPLLAVVSLIRDYRCSFQEQEDARQEMPWEMFDSASLEELIEQTVSALQSGIVGKYLRRGAYSQAEAVHMLLAIAAALNDFVDGGMRPLFEYHEEHFPHVPYTHYRGDKRNRFEYIVSLAREDLIARGRRQNGV